MNVTTINRPTKIQRVFDYMAEGRTLTPGMARSRFRVRNIRATMSDLRGAFDRFGMASMSFVRCEMARVTTVCVTLVVAKLYSLAFRNPPQILRWVF